MGVEVSSGSSEGTERFALPTGNTADEGLNDAEPKDIGVRLW